jgi:hypothetical protein
MNRIIKSYLYRLIREKAFWIIMGLVSFAALLFAIITKVANSEVYKNGGTTAIMSTTMFALMGTSLPTLDIAANLGFSSSASVSSVFSFPIGFISLLVISFFIGREWQNRTFRNQILAGHGRLSIYLSAIVVSLIIAIANLLAFEITLWLFGLLLQNPVFTPTQFANVSEFYDSNTGTTTIHGLTGGPLFAVCFFMSMFLYLVGALIAVSWSFIIPNSWGSLGVFYGMLEGLLLVNLILFLALNLNYIDSYPFTEWLFSNQVSKFQSMGLDSAFKFTTNEYGGHVTETVYGRTLPLVIKTLVSGSILGGGMAVLGGLSFVKRDLK